MQPKQHHKKLPTELLVDIFKAIDGAIMDVLPQKLYQRLTMLQYKEYEKLWLSYAYNLLISSSIVYIFVEKFFKRRWLSILENRKIVKMWERFICLLTTKKTTRA